MCIRRLSRRRKEIASVEQWQTSQAVDRSDVLPQHQEGESGIEVRSSVLVSPGLLLHIIVWVSSNLRD
jgi:hypothetical protein